MLPEQCTRRPSLMPLEPSLLRYMAVLIIVMFFFSLNLCGSDLSCSSNPCRLSVTSQSFNILKQRRDLNSILPVRYIIHKESSMRWGMPVIGRDDWIFYLKPGLSPGLQRPLGCLWGWGVLLLCSSLKRDRTMWRNTTARHCIENFLRLGNMYRAFVHHIEGTEPAFLTRLNMLVVIRRGATWLSFQILLFGFALFCFFVKWETVNELTALYKICCYF